MHDTDQHRVVILDKVFDGNSGIYPLIIVLKEEINGMLFYEGVHFVDTATVLSMESLVPDARDDLSLQLNNKMEEIAIDAKGKKVIFDSTEIGEWCDGAAMGYVTPFVMCDSPFIYRDEQFKEFERIIMKFPAFESWLQDKEDDTPPGPELTAELNEALLRLRRALF